ncbi:MAG: TIGR03905 family TSCPD domain-containing protein [Butyrivibrio sp.]|nr:TIGR03905 family TSCPD domain-containing protein [Butyrivibrio sp.]
MVKKYKTKGTCSTQIDLEVEEGIIKNVAFTGGCNGNLQGVSKLVEGMKAEDAIAKLKGIRCGYKSTSCPDQLATALEQVLAEEAN